jgi:hypothetical protein
VSPLCRLSISASALSWLALLLKIGEHVIVIVVRDEVQAQVEPSCS